MNNQKRTFNKIPFLLTIVLLLFHPSKYSLVYSEQNAFLDQMLNGKPNYRYITDNLINSITFDVYKISYETHRAVSKNRLDINTIDTSQLEMCLSNKDYKSICLAINDDRKSIYPDKYFCLDVELKTENTMQGLTATQKTFLLVMNNKYRELLPYVIPARSNAFRSDYYTAKEIKKMFGEKFIEDYVFNDKKDIFK